MTALEEKITSIDVKDVPLKEVFNMVSADTGYKILINEYFWKRPVTIQLKDINIDFGIKRILKSLDLHNLIVITDGELKTIMIFQSDAPSYQYSGDMTKREDISMNGDESPGNYAPPSESGKPGMTTAEIEELHKQQRQKTNDNAIGTPPSESGEPGMTIAEIQALHKLQRQEGNDNSIGTPPSASGEPGMTVTEIEELHKQQKQKNNDNSIGAPPPGSGDPGMTVSEIKALHKKQRQNNQGTQDVRDNFIDTPHE